MDNDAKKLNTVENDAVEMPFTQDTINNNETEDVAEMPFEPVFDEPTTGLHFHDIQRLLNAFNALIERGHTILVIEHNLDVVKCADYLIDMGPDGGDRGGQVIFAGKPEDIVKEEKSNREIYSFF